MVDGDADPLDRVPVLFAWPLDNRQYAVVIEGYYRDEGWHFALVDPAEEAVAESAQPEELRGVRLWRTKTEWLAQGDHVTARNGDGSPDLVPTESLRDFPDDARIVLRRRVFAHPNADPIQRRADSEVDADSMGEVVVTFRTSGRPSIRWSAAERSHRGAIEEAVAALQHLLDDEVLEKLS